jgi:hypothetical protein
MLMDLLMLNFNLDIDFKVKFGVFSVSAALVSNTDVVSIGNRNGVFDGYFYKKLTIKR